jgi:hypothetical protein
VRLLRQQRPDALILVRLYFTQRSFVLSSLPHRPPLSISSLGARVLNGGRAQGRVIDERMAHAGRQNGNPRGGANKQILAQKDQIRFGPYILPPCVRRT